MPKKEKKTTRMTYSVEPQYMRNSALERLPAFEGDHSKLGPIEPKRPWLDRQRHNIREIEKDLDRMIRRCKDVLGIK